MDRSHEAWQQFRAIPLFRGLSSDAVATISSYTENHTFSPNEFIVRQGAVEQSVWILIGGRCEVIKETSSSGRTQSVKLTELEPFETFGEMTLFNGQPRSANVLAVTDVQSLRLSHESFAHVAGRDPAAGVQLASNMVSIVSRRLQFMDDWLTKILHGSEESPSNKQWNNIRERLQGHSLGHLL